MLGTLIDIALAITVGITGYYALLFIRDAETGMEKATHDHALLPRVMTGRYVVVFLFALGVMFWGNTAMVAWFFAVCAFIGFYDGWLYHSQGRPHGKHTITGVLALGALCLTLVALAQPAEAVG